MRNQPKTINLRTAATVVVVTFASIAGTAAAQEVGSGSALKSKMTVARGSVGSNAPSKIAGAAGTIGAGSSEKVAQSALVKKASLKDERVRSDASPARGISRSVAAIKG